ncbi:MAG: aminotransferase class V-fold PLP-dependent enzyme, partial [Gemmatimonadota bacterium]|nr:aminotransferase class V-fold PLP-dependent enzyme [Gemmatimonadota bacterium]
MTTSRRRFIHQSASTLALAPIVPVGWLAGRGGRDSRQDWVARARAEIPAATGSRYFQTGGIGPSPNAVIEHIQERLAFQNQGPADPRYATDMARIEPDLRARLARVFGAAPEEVALTHSTSEGISIVAWSLNWNPGDEVVISNVEHPANVIPWYVLRDRFGIVIREIDLSTGTGLIDQVRGQLSNRTRMVSISHVSRNNGRALRSGESAELGSLLRARGVRYHLDGAQGPGCVATDFRALGADCYSTCGHKWLLGPCREQMICPLFGARNVSAF